MKSKSPPCPRSNPPAPSRSRRRPAGKLYQHRSQQHGQDETHDRARQVRGLILAPRAELLDTTLTELLDWTRDQPVQIVRPDGGAICCVRLPESEFTDEQVNAFYARLAENDARVGRGSWFGESDRVFRLGFGNLPSLTIWSKVTKVTPT